jgi:hypothetical protein
VEHKGSVGQTLPILMVSDLILCSWEYGIEAAGVRKKAAG